MEIKYVIPFITLLIGGLIGNWLSIGRERRKEFNNTADPIFELLEKQRQIAQSGSYPLSANETNESTFISIRRMLPIYKRDSFDVAIKNYMKAPEKSGIRDDTGRFNFHNPQILISAIEELQKYLPHK